MNFIRKVILFLDRHFLNLFLLSLFLIKIPPFYILYPFQSAFLTTHSLSRIVVLLLFFVFVLKLILEREIVFEKKHKALLTLFLIYLAFQSISVIPALNLGSFFQSYKDVVFSGIFLLLILRLREHYKKIIYVFVASLVFNFFYQIFMFLSPTLFTKIGELLIYQNHFELISINLQRSRLFIETYDEILIPFTFIMLAKAKKIPHRLGILSLLLMILVPSFLSNFRIRIAMVLFAFIASFIFLIKRQIASKALTIMLLLLVSYGGYMILTTLFGFSYVERVLLEDKREDVMSLQGRLNNIYSSVEIGFANPFFGVGLGNYADSGVGNIYSGRVSVFEWRNRESKIASTNPHNIFAQIVSETGILSLLVYLFMLITFFVNDFKVIKSKNVAALKKGFVISFWTLFIYAFFNPSTTLTFNTMFWVLRGLIL